MVAVTSFTEDGESQGGSEESSVGTRGTLPYPWLQGQVTWEGALPITGLSLLPSLLQGTHLRLGTLSNLVLPVYWLSFYTELLAFLSLLGTGAGSGGALCSLFLRSVSPVFISSG